MHSCIPSYHEVQLDEFAEVSGSAHSIPEKSGTSRAFCTAMLKMADSLRLFALFGRSSPENWGTSQAICIFFMKLSDRLRLFALFCTPFLKIEERLRLFACFDTAMRKFADSLRL